MNNSDSGVFANRRRLICRSVSSPYIQNQIFTMEKQTTQLASDQRANHTNARGKVWNDIIQANADSAAFPNAWS